MIKQRSILTPETYQFNSVRDFIDNRRHIELTPKSILPKGIYHGTAIVNFRSNNYYITPVSQSNSVELSCNNDKQDVVNLSLIRTRNEWAIFYRDFGLMDQSRFELERILCNQGRLLTDSLDCIYKDNLLILTNIHL
jgi:hypothetical protein